MYKKVLGLLVVLVSVFTLVSCKKDPVDPDDQDEITISLTTSSATIKVNETHQINFTTNDEEGVLFSSNDEEVASVSTTGLITGLKEGNTTIVITSKTNDEVSKTFTINVLKKDVAIDFEVRGPVSLLLGTSLKYTVANFEANELKFESSNQEVIEVNEEGVVTALETGVATIKVTSLEDELKFDEISINVVDKVLLNASVTTTFEYEDQTFELGSTLFKSLDDLIDKHSVEALDI